MAERPETEIAIVGAGIIGIAAAAYLSEAGRRVLVIDRTGICEETSSGNAGAIAVSDVLPLVQKGMMRNLPKWLADPLGPLAIPPAYLPKLAPWLWRFWRASSPRRYDAALKAQASLMGLAETEWLALMERSGTRPMLRQDGCLELYESEAEFAASLPGWEARRQYGIDFTHLAADEIAAYQPGLSERFVRATFVPGWMNVADPKLLGKALWDHAASHGARFMAATVTAIRTDSGPRLDLADGRFVVAERIVVAAGAWSHRLAAGLGDAIPLETERGYNTTLPADAFDVRRQLVFSAHGFVVTPLSTGLRIGGAVEFAGLDRPPNYARARAMLEKTKRFLPGLKAEGGREWMGYRPSLPDSLPVISRARAHRDIVYAFGHGHLGLTQAAATGRIVADLIADQPPPVDIQPFASTRF